MEGAEDAAREAKRTRVWVMGTSRASGANGSASNPAAAPQGFGSDLSCSAGTSAGGEPPSCASGGSAHVEGVPAEAPPGSALGGSVHANGGPAGPSTGCASGASPLSNGGPPGTSSGAVPGCASGGPAGPPPGCAAGVADHGHGASAHANGGPARASLGSPSEESALRGASAVLAVAPALAHHTGAAPRSWDARSPEALMGEAPGGNSYVI